MSRSHKSRIERQRRRMALTHEILSNSKKVKKMGKILARDYKRELSHYWELGFITRVKLAYAIVFKVRRER